MYLGGVDFDVRAAEGQRRLAVVARVHQAGEERLPQGRVARFERLGLAFYLFQGPRQQVAPRVGRHVRLDGLGEVGRRGSRGGLGHGVRQEPF